MILLYHVGKFISDAKSHKPCLGPAFGVRKQCNLSERIPAENVVKLDGSMPKTGEGLICGTCKKPVHRSWLSYERPVSWPSFQPETRGPVL